MIIPWEGPVVRAGVSFDAVSEMVVTVPGGLLALWLAISPWLHAEPLSLGGKAQSLSVSLVCGRGGSVAIVLFLDVLAVGLVEVAVVLVVSEDNDVLPGGGVPVGPVVALLSALESKALSTGVLTSVHGRPFKDINTLLQEKI